ncbi:transporter [Streptomyces sp. WAC 04229]|uniref:cation:proton antiporter n=1 Tax=Streptomyces sp. WAC 04229 TaxID=2203206 RepID=UPI0003E0AE40|nr:cation:proton antiporter [Streptomyces sp. WAC 04229]AGO99004.1 putative membrane protein [Streptomyces sp. WAC 04229]RSN59699.1 transporter [Streptomyces sp. WAC 04229]
MQDHVSSAMSDSNLELTLDVLPALTVILLTAAVVGRLATLLGQPRVLGEIVAGILLGPTLFGWLAPGLQADVFPAHTRPVLHVLSTIGLTLYMFLVGAGLDPARHESDRKHHPAVLALSGFLPSLVLGGLVGLLMWDDLSPEDVGRWEFSLFVGGALSLTALPMLARMLYERGLQNSRLGRLSLIAASIDDAAAWCFLAALTAVHTGSGAANALPMIGYSLLFTAVMLLGVKRLLRPLARHVGPQGTLSPGVMHVVVIVPIVCGYLTDLIGIYSVFGGFVAGLAMPRDPRFRQALHNRMMDTVSTLLLPIFFCLSGLTTDLRGISADTLLFGVAVLLTGFAGKYFGSTLAMRTLRFSWREAFAVGGLMNARGMMILIFINIGLAQGLITKPVFSVLVVVAVVTSAAALPLYRRALPKRLETQLDNKAPTPAPAPRSLAGVGRPDGAATYRRRIENPIHPDNTPLH